MPRLAGHSVLALGQRGFHLFKNPLVICLKMAVVAIESTVKNMLEQAGALPLQDRIPGNRREIAVRRTGREHLDLPLAFGIVAVAVGVNLRSQVVDPCVLPLGLHVEQGRRGDSFRRADEDFFAGLIQIRDGCSAATDTVSSTYIYCSATNSSGTFIGCYTSSGNEAARQAVATINTTSLIFFEVNSAGQCTYLTVENYSSYL